MGGCPWYLELRSISGIADVSEIVTRTDKPARVRMEDRDMSRIIYTSLLLVTADFGRADQITCIVPKTYDLKQLFLP
jgi:hypothetical protein